MKNWKTVYKTDKLYQAQIVKDYLQDKEFHAIIVDKKDSAYQLGFYEIVVTVDEVMRAIKLIEDEIKFE
jgi:ubiquitin-protein ligase